MFNIFKCTDKNKSVVLLYSKMKIHSYSVVIYFFISIIFMVYLLTTSSACRKNEQVKLSEFMLFIKEIWMKKIFFKSWKNLIDVWNSWEKFIHLWADFFDIFIIMNDIKILIPTVRNTERHVWSYSPIWFYNYSESQRLGFASKTKYSPKFELHIEQIFYLFNNNLIIT